MSLRVSNERLQNLKHHYPIANFSVLLSRAVLLHDWTTVLMNSDHSGSFVHPENTLNHTHTFTQTHKGRYRRYQGDWVMQDESIRKHNRLNYAETSSNSDHQVVSVCPPHTSSICLLRLTQTHQLPLGFSLTPMKM